MSWLQLGTQSTWDIIQCVFDLAVILYMVSHAHCRGRR